jgi:uncharacterized protein YjbI with pentapeptide repeats
VLGETRSLTFEQIASTASYQNKNLRGVSIGNDDLSGWDLSDQDLTDASFLQSVFVGTDLSGALVSGASFRRTVSRGFTPEQLYSTASYQTGDLRRIELGENDLAEWDFSGQNLTDADLSQSSLRGANLSSANLAGAKLNSSDIVRANLSGVTPHGFTKEQLYSTRSYAFDKNLEGVRLADNDLSGWDFSEQSLVFAALDRSVLEGTNFSRADLRGATGVNLSAAVITENTILPDGTVNGLNLVGRDRLTATANIADQPVRIIGEFSVEPGSQFDLTDNAVIVDYSADSQSPAGVIRERLTQGRGGSGVGNAEWTGGGIASSTAAAEVAVSPESRSIGYAENAALPLGPYETFHWVAVDDTTVLMAYTRTGDANLDGVVNDDDVTIVNANYAPGVPQPHWALGDFDYNGFVDDDDVTLLGAFYDPAAEPLASLAGSSVVAVPEPSALALAAFVLLTVGICVAQRRRGNARS